MVMTEIHSNLGHSGVVILSMVNGCNGLNLLAHMRPVNERTMFVA